MNKISRRVVDSDGNTVRRSVDLRSQLNLSYLNLTDKAVPDGKYNIPSICCNTSVYPDYLALYSQVGYYHKTAFTAVCFYEYDRAFDNINGIYNAIYHNNKKLLAYYKERFKGVRFFISPDYSMFADLDEVDNIHQLKKSRVVALWFVHVLHAIVIPSISYVSESEESLKEYFSGLHNCTVIALSLKCHVRKANERRLTLAAIKYAVDNLPFLKAIVVYSVCGKDETERTMLKYAIDRGIKIIVPDNSLRDSHRRECGA